MPVQKTSFLIFYSPDNFYKPTEKAVAQFFKKNLQLFLENPINDIKPVQCRFSLKEFLLDLRLIQIGYNNDKKRKNSKFPDNNYRILIILADKPIAADIIRG